MTHDDHIVDLERRTFQLFSTDGSVDLVLGLGLIALGVSWHVDGVAEPVIVFLSWLFLLTLWRSLRRRMVEPRIGHVRLHPSRMKRLRRGKVALCGMFVASMLVLLTVKLVVPDWGRSISSFAYVFWCGIVTAGGHVLEFPRLYAYGGLMATSFVVSRFVGLPHEYGTIATGIIVTLTSMVIVARFIQRHPVQPLLARYDG